MEGTVTPLAVLERQGLSRITEADLMGRVGRPLRVCECACGGHVAGVRDDWDDVTEALRAHQAGRLHREWRKGQA